MESRLYLNIPVTINVGYKLQYDYDIEDNVTVGFVTYKNPNGTLSKPNAWEKWRDKSIDPRQFANSPTKGFSIRRAVGGHGGWSSRKAWCRITDPRGFDIEISFENLIFLLNHCGYSLKEDKGTFDCEMVYAWDGTKLVLCPVNSPDYTYSQELDSKKEIKVTDCQIGHWYTIKKEKGTILYLYCGKVNKLTLSRETGIEGTYLVPTYKEIHLFRRYFTNWPSTNFFFEELSDNVKTRFLECPVPSQEVSTYTVEESLRGFYKSNCGGICNRNLNGKYQIVNDSISFDESQDIEEIGLAMMHKEECPDSRFFNCNRYDGFSLISRYSAYILDDGNLIKLYTISFHSRVYSKTYQQWAINEENPSIEKWYESIKDWRIVGKISKIYNIEGSQIFEYHSDRYQSGQEIMIDAKNLQNLYIVEDNETCPKIGFRIQKKNSQDTYEIRVAL